MDRRLRLTSRGWLALPAVVVLTLGARLIATALGLPDLAGSFGLLLLLGAVGAVGFVRSERRREREVRAAGKWEAPDGRA